MEIELPDGTVLEAPDGADVKAVVRGYQRQVRIAELKAKQPEEYDPESIEYKRKMNPQDYVQEIRTRGNNPKDASGKPLPMPYVKTGDDLAGIGSGMVRTARGLTNLALPESITPEFASDEKIREHDKMDEGLPLGPRLLGSIAASAPLSGATGALLSTASKAAPAGSALARTLASPWSRTALEGATQGAIYADPDEQAEGAVFGATLGLGLRGLGQGGKKLVNGIVEKSQAAKDLAQLAGQHGEEIFVPLSQAASDEGNVNRLMKSFYKEALPIVPGTRGRMERQAAEAADKLRELALREALPSGGTLPAAAGSKVDDAVASIQKQFDKAYNDTVKSYAFNVPSTLKQDLAKKVAASAPANSQINQQTLNKVVSETEALMKQFSDGKGVIDGTNLLNVKRELSALMGMARGHEKSAFQAADGFIDDIITTELKQGGKPQNLADLQRYLELTPAWRAFAPVKTAAAKFPEKEGQFLFRTLARAAKNSPEQKVLGKLGAATVDKPVGMSTKTGQVLASLGMLGSGPGLYMAPGAVGGMLATGNLLSTKTAQKMFMGDTKTQKLIAELLRKNPGLARRLGSAGRTAVVSEAVN